MDTVTAPRIRRNVEGIDPDGMYDKFVAVEENNLLQDPFARRVLLKLPASERPMSLSGVMAALGASDGEQDMSFVVGDGSQVRTTTQVFI
jgi:hypothetical protein